MDEFCQHFEAAIPSLKKNILAVFASKQSQAEFRSIWTHFEEIVNPVLRDFLQGEPLKISPENITEAKSKSVYPDLKVIHNKKLYAIDVKSGEDVVNPWYDIGRLDTYAEKHLQKYDAEYCVTIKWQGREPSAVIDLYIEPTYKSVGYRPTSDGVLYRPYDGKLRPKTWKEFENGESHWENIEHFKKGLEASRNFRQISLLAEWYKEMEEPERLKLKEILDAIDKGKPTETDDVLPVNKD